MPRRAASVWLAVVVAVSICGGCAEKDRDRDGYSVKEGDCNDDAAAVNPMGSVTVESCSWAVPEYSCSRGADKAPEPDDQIRVRLVNNRCAPPLITDASAQTTIVEAHGTYNHVGEVWAAAHTSVVPSSLSAGTSADVLVDARITCTNLTGGGLYNVVQGTVTLQTSAGPITATTSNTHTTRFQSGESQHRAGRVAPEAALALPGGGPSAP